MLNNFVKYKLVIAVGIILLFHVSALIGLIFTDNDLFFKNNTPLNLIICLVLILFTHQKFNTSFWTFFIVSFSVGLIFEIIGVNTQILFGLYEYSDVLGMKVKNVPIFLGFLWFITMYCVGGLAYQILEYLKSKNKLLLNSLVYQIIFCVLAAFFAVLLDYFLEPVAINFNLWNWLTNGEIPIYNYVCWFFCSFVIQLVFINTDIFKNNKFSIYLYGTQLFFFLILNFFYL